jgi:hypothetical protein
MPLAVVNADAPLGSGVIINTGAANEHDCVVMTMPTSPRIALWRQCSRRVFLTPEFWEQRFFRESASAHEASLAPAQWSPAIFRTMSRRRRALSRLEESVQRGVRKLMKSASTKTQTVPSLEHQQSEEEQ